MITKEEIQEKCLEFGILQANVQRDYLFGWLLVGIYSSSLKDNLVLKGGNCFRKAYFPHTRFSRDLDFSIQRGVNEDSLLRNFNDACGLAGAYSGVKFEIERNKIQLQADLGNGRRVFDIRLYFKDFFGNADHIVISLSIDVTEFDQIYLPIQDRKLIHPYSDSKDCSGTIRCWKLEEMLASKLKCLLQRRHIPDLYDLVVSIFVNRDIAVNHRELLSTFFKKTIYERYPGFVKQLLLDVPFDSMRLAWSKYIEVPVQGVILEFDVALEAFRKIINGLFTGHASIPRSSTAPFFPSHFRNPILDAGAGLNLMEITYDNYTRIIEPYSLIYKRRKDGHAEEYFYAYDRTGGHKGPGIKLFTNDKVQVLKKLDEVFEPRFPVEITKAGEAGSKGYFSKSFAGSFGPSFRSLRRGWRYTIECNYCNRQFKRFKRYSRLNPHRDQFRNNCPGRLGHWLSQEYLS